MPAMPRPNKKSEKIAYRILGKPENVQDTTKVYKSRDDHINRTLDSWYNHKY